MHFRCRCGHSISDSTDHLWYKGYLHSDAQAEAPLESVTGIVRGFLAAEARGERQQFLRAYLQGNYHNSQLLDSNLKRIEQWDSAQIISMFYDDFWYLSEISVYECENCGRFWIDLSSGGILPFLPEGDYGQVLKRAGDTSV